MNRNRYSIFNWRTMTFIKHPGGKASLIPELSKYFPLNNNNNNNDSRIDGYIEPFVGGGAVFFYLKQNGYLTDKTVYLSDINPELINCYKVIKNHLSDLIKSLNTLEEKHNEEYYYKVRNNFHKIKLNDISKAAYFIYLNKTAFNGQLRYNLDGNFNMGIGHKEKIQIYDRKTLPECSKLLQNTDIRTMSFEKILEILKQEQNKDKKFFIYLDSPYDDIDDGSNSFTSYTKDKWSEKRHFLRTVFKELDNQGHKVMLSNIPSPILLNEFKEFNIYIIKARRTGAANPASRGLVDEVVITNYKQEKRKTLFDF